ncbi:MAG: hypothetical protein KQI35_17330 [Bacteroidetes bacterium]|nr:hypothetical protein [Bacteroidota bacterium]
MTKINKLIASLTILLSVTMLVSISGCQKDEEPTPVPPKTTSYNLMAEDVLGISGRATFTETNSGAVTIDILLTGAASGTHPAELCVNSAVEGGSVIITLNPVDATGKSSTVETTMTYAQLIVYDGFIHVLKSSTEPDVILAQGDIGGNVITATSKTFELDTLGSFGVSGSALFEKRVNGNTLLTITISGAIAGEMYPATINLGSIETVGGGPVVMTLNDVDGTSGKSYTNIRKLDSGIVIIYDNWLVYDGYINIYQDSVSLNNIICHGNIGSN